MCHDGIRFAALPSSREAASGSGATALSNIGSRYYLAKEGGHSEGDDAGGHEVIRAQTRDIQDILVTREEGAKRLSHAVHCALLLLAELQIACAQSAPKVNLFAIREHEGD